MPGPHKDIEMNLCVCGRGRGGTVAAGLCSVRRQVNAVFQSAASEGKQKREMREAVLGGG